MAPLNRLVLFHPMDPRGGKLGGIETHVRLVLAHHPADTAVLLVGIDEIGDRRLGVPGELLFEGRRIAFMPVLRADPATVNKAAGRIRESLTLRFALAALRRLGTVRRALGDAASSCEIERFEFAMLPRLLRRPFVLLVHNEGSREDKMDSLLKRHWYLHRASERIAATLADRIFAVNPSIAERLARLSAAFAAKTDVLSVSVDTRRFAPTPFDLADRMLRVCVAGRLDAFKDPPLMMATLAALAERLAAAPAGPFTSLRFDYVGASDPTVVPGFERIAGSTERHGPRSAAEVAAIMRGAHLGLITSFFEGLPCYLLEMLASGRPVVAVDLPQFAPLIRPGVSGRIVPRSTMPDATAAALADAALAVAGEIGDGLARPDSIAALAAPYSVDAQMSRLFACHAALAAVGQPSASASAA